MTDQEYNEAVLLYREARHHFRMLGDQCLENRLTNTLRKMLEEEYGRHLEGGSSADDSGGSVQLVPDRKSTD